MPLLNHFQPPLSTRRPWAAIHGFWASMITQQLSSGPLPDGYYALPNTHVGGQAQIDVATFEETDDALQSTSQSNGATATATWSPPKADLTFSVDFTDVDVFEIRIYLEATMELVAAIELVSPANKDRPGHRRAFATKCASYLSEGVSVIVIDVVTERQANLHQELMQLLSLGSGETGNLPALSVVTYRTRSAPDQPQLDVWLEALEIGSPLPVVPLWLSPELSVPLDLELSYQTTCRDLRLI